MFTDSHALQMHEPIAILRIQILAIKKVSLVAKVFCGHAYSTDLIGRIRKTSKLWRKKSHWLNESACCRTNKPWRNNKTVRF